MSNPTQAPSFLEMPRRRLFREHARLRSWHRVADKRGTNVAYVYDFAVHGKVPVNPQVRKALGIPIRPRRNRSSCLIEGVEIHDQPLANLRNALINRQELP